MRRLSRFILSGGLVASVLLVSGCAAAKVVGRVLPGTISHVGVVDATDDRMGTSGLAGIEVTLSPVSGDGTTSYLGRAVSQADGSFSIKIDSTEWPVDRVMVRATGDDYATARGSVYLPKGDKRLLILMERTAGD